MPKSKLECGWTHFFDPPIVSLLLEFIIEKNLKAEEPWLEIQLNPFF
jgi:hypothetical protein